MSCFTSPNYKLFYRWMAIFMLGYLSIWLYSWVKEHESKLRTCLRTHFHEAYFPSDAFVGGDDGPEGNDSEQLCVIPILDPFKSEIVNVIKSPENISCDEHFPLLFNSTVESTLVPVISREEFRARMIGACWYTGFARKDGSDYTIRNFGRRYPISLDGPTEIEKDMEFITVECEHWSNSTMGGGSVMIIKKSKELADMFPFVPFKTAVKERVALAPPQSEDRLSVLIFGLDSVSRANFIREMPKSYDYILNQMGGIEMQGYNKIGEDTFSSIVPMLTSHPTRVIMDGCAKNRGWWFDTCHFIWSDFANQGYVTSFAEDGSKTIFTVIGSGFRKSPTDYYLRPFSVLADRLFGPVQSYVCQGPRLLFQTLLEYAKKMAYTMNMNNQPFFHFCWASTLTHEAVNSPMLGDQYLKETLQWFKEEKQLNNTILILMSDHGMRWGPVKETDTVQGQLEDRLPFMYFILPDWFEETYPRALKNLKENTKRLMTTHDLHYTLQDILNSTFDEYTLEKRELELETKLKEKSSRPMGISLFLPIPPSRMCSHTLIQENFCVCNKYEKIPHTSSTITAAAWFVVSEINLQIEQYYSCQTLALHKVVMAQQKTNDKMKVSYLINFKTAPGMAEFEALVERGPRSWRLVGSVSRINKYGNQANCINDRNVKPFCFCKKRQKRFNKLL